MNYSRLYLPLLLGFLLFPPSCMALVPRQVSRNTSIAPIVIPASQDWDGNDGPWSSFTIQVGTPPQVVKVLISTAATQTWVVLPQGCTTSDPSNCETSRGDHFLVNKSSTWQPNTATPNGSIYNLGLEGSLGYSGNGLYGFDDVVLGWPGSGGPTLKNQTVAGVATKDFYMGVFGLHPGTSNFSGWNDPIPSYMQNLRNQSLIPSISWSYTAGNQYRLNSVLGSLVLGGYDASKFALNNVSFPFNEEDVRDLTVHIDRINVNDSSGSSSLLPTSIPAYIDSTVPYIWLPVEACALFEEVFGLTYDNETELYLVNNTQHTRLLSLNLGITFTLGNLTAGMEVNVTLPYAAFDLSVSYPIVANTTRYFPLKRAANATQYTLGRTFLQEAYVIADYERRTFSVSQCSWDAAAKADIIPIFPPNATDTSSSSNPSNSTSSSTFTISAGVIAGIALGIIVILVLIATFILFSVRKRRRTEKARLAAAANKTIASDFSKPELDANETQLEMSHEVDGQEKKVYTEVEGMAIYEAQGDEGMVIHEVGDGNESGKSWREIVFEVGGDLRMAVELGDSERQIYELPAREEVAAEMGEREIGTMGNQKGGVLGESDNLVTGRDFADTEREDASSIQEEYYFCVRKGHP